MVHFSHYELPAWWRKGSSIFLAFSWISGLAVGIILFFFADDQMILWMRSVVTGSVSIVSLLCVTILPFLFSAFAVFISEPWLLLLISFGKAMCFSFISLGFLCGFGSAGWLIRLLLMFSDFAALPLLYCFFLRYISGSLHLTLSDFFTTVSLCILIGSVDYCLIAPLMAWFIHS